MGNPDSTLIIGTYTSTGTALGLITAIAICAAYCHTSDHHTGRPLWSLKLLTIYNISMVVANLTQSYYLYAFLSTQETFSGVGVETNSVTQNWVWVHVGSQVSNLIDTCYMIARGGDDRISYASCFHITTIFGIWGLCIDNRRAVFVNGTIVFIAMMMSVQAIAIYTYRIFSTWGKCITPGSQISTGFQITLLSILSLHGGYILYYAVDDGSVARGVCNGVWLIYFIIMTVLVMSLMFKQRSNRCCSSHGSSRGPPQVTLPITNDPV